MHDDQTQNRQTMEAADLKSMDISQLAVFLGSLGEPPFRAKQIFEWMHKKRAVDLEQMTNLSKDLRSRLRQSAKLTVLRPVRVQTSKLDGTKKYLFALEDETASKAC